MALIGEPVDLSYPYEHLGEGAAALAKVLKGGPALEDAAGRGAPGSYPGPRHAQPARPRRRAAAGARACRECEARKRVSQCQAVPGHAQPA